MRVASKFGFSLLKSLSFIIVITVEVVEPLLLLVVHALTVHCVGPDKVELGVLFCFVRLNQLLLRADAVLEDAHDQHSQPCCRFHDVLTLLVKESFVVLLDNVAQPDHALY